MDTIKSSEEIGLIFHQGKRISLPELNLIIREVSQQRDHHGRVAFIAGKKLGNAVWRNRAKRRLRALYQQLEKDNQVFFETHDVLFIAKNFVSSSSFHQTLDRTQASITKL